MAHTAMFSDAGVRYHTNQDAACVQVARTCVGEVAMIVVCDGVGGLSWGELASSMVVERFCEWFKHELPKKLRCMASDEEDVIRIVKTEWDAVLSLANTSILECAETTGHLLGTTVSAVFVLGGAYVAVQVGDGRILKLDHTSLEQVSEDQTLLAHKLRMGIISSEQDASRTDANTILQAVGSQNTLQPVFYHGSVGPDELLVVCCDGVWHRLQNSGIHDVLRHVDFLDGELLEWACKELIRRALDLGETDNMTIACLSGDLEGAAGEKCDA